MVVGEESVDAGVDRGGGEGERGVAVSGFEDTIAAGFESFAD